MVKFSTPAAATGIFFAVAFVLRYFEECLCGGSGEAARGLVPGKCVVFVFSFPPAPAGTVSATALT